MKRINITPRCLALILILALSLPPPAFALRGQQQEDPSQLTGLEGTLKNQNVALTLAPSKVTPLSSPKTGMEEGALPLREVYQRLRLLLKVLPAPTVLIMDVNGVSTEPWEALSASMAEMYGGFIQDVPNKQGQLACISDMTPWELQTRVLDRLSPEVLSRTTSFPMSGAEFIGHEIPEEAIKAMDDLIARLGGKEKILRMGEILKQHGQQKTAEESLTHGYAIHRTQFPKGSIANITVRFDINWLQAQVKANQDVDPRDQWVEELRSNLRKNGTPDSILGTLHKVGRASLTWAPPKGIALRLWVEKKGIDPRLTMYVDDTADYFKSFPDVAGWPGTLVYIGRYDAELAALAPNVIQVTPPGRPKPTNGVEIAREAVRVVRVMHRADHRIAELLRAADPGRTDPYPLMKEEAFGQLGLFEASREEVPYWDGRMLDFRRKLPKTVEEAWFVSDLHAQWSHLSNVLRELDNLEKLQQGKAILFILGDAEPPELTEDRPLTAEDMETSIVTVQWILDLMIRYPKAVFYTLGNHSILWRHYRLALEQRYGQEYVRRYEQAFLRNTPVGVIGDGFAAFHGRPPENLTGTPDEILNQIKGIPYERLLDSKDYATFSLLGSSLAEEPDPLSAGRKAKRFLEAVGQPDGILVGGHIHKMDFEQNPNRYRPFYLIYSGANVPRGRYLVYNLSSRSMEYRTPIPAGLEEVETMRAHLRWTQALAAARILDNRSHRSGALAAIAGHQAVAGQDPTGIFTEALVTIPLDGSNENELARSLVLAAMAIHPAAMGQGPKELFTPAIAAAQRISVGSDRSKVLAAIAEHQAAAGQWTEALETARIVEYDKYHSQVLAAIAEHQAAAGRWTEALETAHTVQRHYFRSKALAAIAEHQAAAGQDSTKIFTEALGAARAGSSSDEFLAVFDYPRALAEIAEHQAAAGQDPTETFAEALAAAQRISDGFARSLALAAIAEHQAAAGQDPTETFAEALVAAGRIRWSVTYSKAIAAIAEHQAAAGQWTEALETARAIREGFTRSETLAQITGYRAVVRGSVQKSREEIQVEQPGLLEQAEARQLLYFGLLFPGESEQWHHDLVRLRDQGYLTPQQFNQYMAALTLSRALRQYGILPASYGSIQVRWLGSLQGIGSGLQGLRRLRLVQDPAPTLYAPVEGVIPAHFVYADNEEYLTAFRNLWVFDEAHRKPFLMGGRGFIGLGISMDGSSALYLDEATGALCSMCIDMNRTQTTYATDLMGIMQGVYQQGELSYGGGGGIDAVRQTLEELRNEDQVQAVLRLTANWIKSLPLEDQEELNRPIEVDRWLSRKTNYMEFVSSKIQEFQQQAPRVAEEYFLKGGEGEVTYVKPLGVHFTERGLRWLADLLKLPLDPANPRQILWELGMLQLLYQSNLILNPDPILRILRALEGGKGLGFYDPSASHREALKGAIVPALQSGVIQANQNFRLEVWVESRSVPLEQGQLGTPLVPFLQVHFPAALQQGVYIWNRFVPAPLLSEYVVLPGDAYGLEPQFAGAPQEYARRLQQLLGESPAEETPPAAGMEERMPGWLGGRFAPQEFEGIVRSVHDSAVLGSQPIALLFDPGLVPGESDPDRQVLLAGLEESLRAALAWPPERPLRLDLLAEGARLESAGFLVIQVLRHPEGQQTALPESALPLVAAEALAQPRARLYVDPLSYAGLEEVTLPEILATLADLFA